MKYLHFIIALFCTTLILPFNSVLAQDGEKEGDAAQGGDTGGAAPAEGGGDTAAGGGDAAPATAPTPAAGGDGGGDAAAAAPAAPAPAAGGQAAAAPAPAPATPAAAPAFDMGSAVQAVSSAPPPATVAAESNPIVSTVIAASASSGGEKISINAVVQLVSDLGGVGALKDAASGEGSSLADLGRNIKASYVTVKVAQAKGEDIKTAMKKFVDYKKEVLADPNKDFASSMSAVAAFAVDEAKEADINLDDLDLFIGTAQYAQANGGGKAAMKDANTLDDDAKRNTAGQKQDDVKKNVENSGGDKSSYSTYAQGTKEGRDMSNVKTALKDINGKPILVNDGGKIKYAPFQDQEFFLVFSSSDGEGSGPELMRLKFSDKSTMLGIEADQGALTKEEITGTTVSFDENKGGWKFAAKLVAPSVLEFKRDEDGETVTTLVKVILYKGKYVPLPLDFGNPDSGDENDIFATTYDKAFLDKLDKANTFADLDAKILSHFDIDLNDLGDDEIPVFLGSGTAALERFDFLYEELSEPSLKDANGKTVLVSFGDPQTDPEGGSSQIGYYATDLDGAVLYHVGNDSGKTTKFNHTVTMGKTTFTKDGKTYTYSIVADGQLIKSIDPEGIVRYTYIEIVTDHNGNKEYQSFTVEFSSASAIDYDKLYDFLDSPRENKTFSNHLFTDSQAAQNWYDNNVGGSQGSGGSNTLSVSDYSNLSAIDQGGVVQNHLNSLQMDEVSRQGYQAGLDMLNRLLTPELNLANGTYLGNVQVNGNTITTRLADINPNFDPTPFLDLLVQFNQIGDKDPSNKSRVEAMVDALFRTDGGVRRSWITKEDINNPDGTTKNVSTYAHLLDGILNSDNSDAQSGDQQRGYFSTNPAQQYRSDDLQKVRGYSSPNNNDKHAMSGKALDFDVETIDDSIKIISGKAVKLSGTVTDLDDHVNETDVTIIASGRDTIITDSLTIQTPESTEEDLYVIAAADELYLRSEYIAANSADYINPPRISVNAPNTNLALAAVDEMNLVNVDITTGGSLAIASLDEMNIWSTSGHNTFSVGVNGDDFEGLFLYADEMIKLNGLDIQGRVDDIYMEAYSIQLNNVNFPGNSAVLLRSGTGKISFLSDLSSFEKGRVNFNNVSHLGATGGVVRSVQASDFKHNVDHVGNVTTNTNSVNRPYIEVQKLRN